jgi:hypothetical protein
MKGDSFVSNFNQFVFVDGAHICEWPNDPSSATRRTGRDGCNRDAPAGSLQRMVRALCVLVMLSCSVS